MSFEVGLQEVPYCLEFEASDLMNGNYPSSYYSTKSDDSCMFNDDPVAKLRADNLSYLSQYGFENNKGPSPLLGSQSSMRQPSSQYSSESSMPGMRQPSTQYSSESGMRQPSTQYSSESGMRQPSTQYSSQSSMSGMRQPSTQNSSQSSMSGMRQPSTQYSSQYPYSSVIVTSLQSSQSPASSFSNSPAHSPQRVDDYSVLQGDTSSVKHILQQQQQQQQQHQGRLQQPLAAFGLPASCGGNFYFDPNNRRRKQDFELSSAEYEKRRLRRERNKLAALRCRTRRRERIDVLEIETAEIEGDNASVESEIRGLQSQVDELQKILRDHDCHRQIDLTDSIQSKSDKIKREPVREPSTCAPPKDSIFSLK